MSGQNCVNVMEINLGVPISVRQRADGAVLLGKALAKIPRKLSLKGFFLKGPLNLQISLSQLPSPITATSRKMCLKKSHLKPNH